MNIAFPYEAMRSSQDELINDILDAVKNRKNLIVHAPTGLGKTIAAFAPAIPHVIKENKTLIFVTPRHTQHVLAVETLKHIKEKFDLDFPVVDLVGKRSMCALSGVHELSSGEFGEYCKQMIEAKACDFFTNVYQKKQPTMKAQKVLKELASSALHSEEMREKCIANVLCPYEISTLLGKKAKAIVADYFHMMDPFIRPLLLGKMDIDPSNVVLVIDEAHNVVDRVRDVMSTKISTFNLNAAMKEAKKFYANDLVKGIVQMNDALERLIKKKTSIQSSESLITKKEFLELLDLNLAELIDGLKGLSDKVRETQKKCFASGVAGFLGAWGGVDKGFVRILKKGFADKGGAFISLEYKCMDASVVLKEMSEELDSIIFMSGTLSPTSVYKDMFGIEAECKEYRSPFPIQNKLNLVVPDTTTKYTSRSEEMYLRIAKKCTEIVNAVPGNTILFFPSYFFRDKVNEHFSSLCNKTSFLENKRMDKTERKLMLAKFKSYKDTGAVLLGVAAGSYGEGVDLMGDALKAVVVVGLPLGKPDLETQELIKYYDGKFNKGWYYGYTLPAIVKVFQNAGRCIRSETDKGIVVFLDERYTWDNYFSCFPKGEYMRIAKDPVERIEKFFNGEGLS
jgi:DNA excision repair protein ERCC-2